MRVPNNPARILRRIVAELETDLAAVEGAKQLKAKMEARIKAAIGRVWGNHPPNTPEV